MTRQLTRRLAVIGAVAAVTLTGATTTAEAAAPAAATAGLTGTLLAAPSGTAVAGAKVTAVDDATGRAARVTTTASDGTFTLKNLAAGSYSVLFGKADDPGYVSTWSPGTAVKSQAAHYDVTRGTGRIDATLLESSTATVRVVDAATGKPVTSGTVYVRRVSGITNSGPTPTADSTGTVVITGLAPGHHVYQASVPRVGGPSPYQPKQFGSDVAEPGSQQTLRTVRLQPAGA